MRGAYVVAEEDDVAEEREWEWERGDGRYPPPLMPRWRTSGDGYRLVGTECEWEWEEREWEWDEEE